jgi:hypothetical protein
MQALQVLEGLVLAHQLHERRDHRVRGAARRRIGDLDLALVLGLEQVGPGPRHRHLLLREELGVVAEAERPGVDADGLVSRLLRLLLRPLVQLRQGRRRYSSVRSCSAACRCGSPVPPNQTSVFGFAFSAMSCASASPEPLSDMLTRVPVVFA